MQFENLRLKPDIIDQFGLPVVIKYGFVGKLDLFIPWKQLFPTPTQPVRAQIDQVFLVVSAKDFRKEDFEKMEERARTSKIEAIKNLNEKGKVVEKSSTSFTTKLVTSIVNNIQVIVMILLLLLLCPFIHLRGCECREPLAAMQVFIVYHVFRCSNSTRSPLAASMSDMRTTCPAPGCALPPG